MCAANFDRHDTRPPPPLSTAVNTSKEVLRHPLLSREARRAMMPGGLFVCAVSDRSGMALFDDGQLCPYCKEPMFEGQNLLGFTFVGSQDALVREIDDSVVHADCLSRHPKRDRIVRAWNAEAKQYLGPQWMLAIGRDGRVRDFTWLDSVLYRLGFRRY